MKNKILKSPVLLIAMLIVQFTASVFYFPINIANAVGTTYYVDSSITDTNVASATPDCTTYNSSTFSCSGGSASAYKTVADVNAKSFSPGDQVLFRRGQTWQELFRPASAGASGNPIFYGAFGTGAKPIIDGTGVTVPDFTALVQVNFAYITLDNLEIKNSGRDGVGCYNVAGFTLTNSSANNNNFYGANIYNCSNVTVSTNDIYSNSLDVTTAYAGIRLNADNNTSWSNFTISNNTIHNNIGGSTGFSDTADGIYIGHVGNEPTFNSVLITQNEIYSNGNTAQTQAGRGISGSFNGDIIVSKNYFHDQSASGMFIGSAGLTTTITIFDNLFKNNRLRAFGWETDGVARAYNNTTYAGDISYPGIGFEIEGNGTFDIKNNIFFVATPNTFSGFIFIHSGTSTATLSKNLYYDAAHGAGSVNYNWRGVEKNFTDWVAASGETGSIEADPRFTNPGGNNFSLASTSPAIDAGLNLGATYQLALASGSSWPLLISTLNQNANGPAWDMGAYVYTQSTAPSASITSPSGGAVISGNQNITATALAASPASISSVNFYADGVLLGAASSTSSPAYSWNSAGTSNGSHALTAIATDNYGNSTTSAAVNITVSNTPNSGGGGALYATFSNVAISSTTATSTVISWQSNYAVGSEIDYGTNTGYGSTLASSTATTTHQLTLTNLTPSTTYHFRIKDPVLPNYSADYLFTTQDIGSTTTTPQAPAVPSAPITTTTPTTEISLRLINNNGTYYLIQNNQLHGVTNPGILFSYGFEFKDATLATTQDLALPTGNLLLPDSGALVKSKEDQTVYLISEGQRHGFVSAKVFTDLGFKFSSVLLVTNPELQALPLGNNVSDSTSAHMDGIDVSYQGTVYWINNGTRYPYPSLDVYNSWHMDGDFSRVVTANAADIALPVGEMLGARVVE